jgi:hypothetical protein
MGARKPRCFMCERVSPGVSSHTFRSGIKLDLCLRCTGRVVGIVERELEAGVVDTYAIVCVCGHESALHGGDHGDGPCMTCVCPRFAGGG